MLEIGRGFGGKKDLKQNMKICCLSNKTELNKDVERLLRLSPGDDDYVEDVWKSLNLSCLKYLNLCSLCFNSVLTKKIHSSASRAVQPSRSQYDQRYRRKKL